MSRMLYFDAASGVSGDMFVGALLDVGACLETVRHHLDLLKLDGIELQARKTCRRGIAATKFDVLDPGTGCAVDAPPQHKGAEHGRAPRNKPFHDHGEGQHQHRGLKEIRHIIGESRLPRKIKADALAVFELMARAEAKVHGVALEQVYFHEVGALDCIADIVAATSVFHQLDIAEAWCSPIHVGSGRVRCAHGVLPVPAPATLELLHGIPAYATGIRGELATPTGVALLKYFCKGFAPMPHMVTERAGYGAGSKELEVPNLLRAILGSVPERALPPGRSQSA